MRGRAAPLHPGIYRVPPPPGGVVRMLQTLVSTFHNFYSLCHYQVLTQGNRIVL